MPRREWQPEIEPIAGSSAIHPKVGLLSLNEAVGRVVHHSPALKAAFVEVQAKRGEELQASVKPNPDLKIDIEDFLGAGRRSGFESSQETVSIVQLFEFGDKRVKRLRAASLDTAVSGWELETTRVKVILMAVQAYVDVQAAQERIVVLNKAIVLSEKTEEAVRKRINVGNTSPIELDRAKVSTARARAAIKSEEARFNARRLRLSALWGSTRLDFDRVAGKLGNGVRVPPTERVLAYIDNNPLIARWSDEIGRRSAVLDVEVAKSVRDFSVGAGVRHYADTDDAAVVVSISTPLKIFDTNAGAITAAEQRVTKAEYERDAARVELTGSVAEAMSMLSVAAAQVRSLAQEVLPAAESAYEKTRKGYEEARFDLLNVLDTQRTLFEVRLDLVNARADFEKAKVQVEALIGRPLTEI
ncbi:TolC family protein [Filomicrobium sp.]|uniref:TolC family protein n=1 Tax=Filomicrobium sp. TaxID=2024831 RepID=UPI00258489BF|nr:TolC family protein [Filomicrobium sp.]MCV0371778.1 TolC family protein [Filomicrobium sp.]